MTCSFGLLVGYVLGTTVATLTWWRLGASRKGAGVKP